MRLRPGRSGVLEASGHAEMDEEVTAALEHEDQILATAANVADDLADQLGRDDLGRLGPGQPAVEDLDVVERPPAQAAARAGSGRSRPRGARASPVTAASGRCRGRPDVVSRPSAADRVAAPRARATARRRARARRRRGRSRAAVRRSTRSPALGPAHDADRVVDRVVLRQPARPEAERRAPDVRRGDPLHVTVFRAGTSRTTGAVRERRRARVATLGADPALVGGVRLAVGDRRLGPGDVPPRRRPRGRRARAGARRRSGRARAGRVAPRRGASRPPRGSRARSRPRARAAGPCPSARRRPRAPPRARGRPSPGRARARPRGSS